MMGFSAPEPLPLTTLGHVETELAWWQVHAGKLISIQLRQHRGLISVNELALWKRTDDVTASGGYQLLPLMHGQRVGFVLIFCLFPGVEG